MFISKNDKDTIKTLGGFYDEPGAYTGYARIKRLEQIVEAMAAVLDLRVSYTGEESAKFGVEMKDA